MVIITSCDFYHPREIIKNGDLLIKKDGEQFDSLIKMTNRLALSYCTSALDKSLTRGCLVTEIFQYYDSVKDINRDTRNWNISDKEDSLIRKYYPIDDISRIIVIKDICVSFVLLHMRDYNNKDLVIVYCFDESKFKKCFPGYQYYSSSQNNNIPEKSNWVYFYDKNWAITPCDVFLQIDSTECRKIVQNEK